MENLEEPFSDFTGLQPVDIDAVIKHIVDICKLLYVQSTFELRLGIGTLTVDRFATTYRFMMTYHDPYIECEPIYMKADRGVNLFQLGMIIQHLLKKELEENNVEYKSKD